MEGVENIRQIETTLDRLIDSIVLKLPSIAIGFIILFLGRYFIRFAINMINRRFDRRNVSPSIRTFITSLLKFVLYTLLILTVANTMGIQTTSFIAILSAFGLAVGMALQGSLSNFAGGVLILVFKPFEVGDYISAANGSSGTVGKIDLLYTTMTDDDGVTVFSPNGPLANSVIKNYTKITKRRFTHSFTASYDTDMKTARAAILDLLKNEGAVLETPAPTMEIGELTDGGLKLQIRGWTERPDYWATYYATAEKIKTILNESKIMMPQASIKVLSDAVNPENLPDNNTDKPQ
ncbi:mechanosensitive ion channel family protein [Sphingobacterium hungaricum]|uniref:Mechanosensitive ion channel protein MscS n=1 Tax=Sphingobacterium hungaricum TaxID=2082723 RepID=A0A928UXD1_9SPHI|nr:mechanosensitive ion channel family protein [Sphingobacterium hungaricum]MBE8714442.1 mechanosensitive ion channel protein MscS [Sphingobacterium hungaricum]